MMRRGLWGEFQLERREKEWEAKEEERDEKQ